MSYLTAVGGAGSGSGGVWRWRCWNLIQSYRKPITTKVSSLPELSPPLTLVNDQPPVSVWSTLYSRSGSFFICRRASSPPSWNETIKTCAVPHSCPQCRLQVHSRCGILAFCFFFCLLLHFISNRMTPKGIERCFHTNSVINVECPRHLQCIFFYVSVSSIFSYMMYYICAECPGSEVYKNNKRKQDI